MPSRTRKQATFMRAACHSAKVRQGKIPKKVACEYARADQSKGRRKR